MSRRSFIKACTAMAAMLGIAPSMLSEVVEAAEKRLPVVVWLHGHECTGCSEAFIRSGAPMASDVVLNMIALEYDDTLAAASGQPFEEHLQEIIKAYDGQYILAVEGAVPALADSGYCMVGGHAFINQLKKQQLIVLQLLTMVLALHGAVFKLLDQILHNLLAYLILLVINLLSMYQVAHQFQK